MAKELLILDDDNALRRTLSRAMAQRGFSVMQAASVKEAREQIQITSPDFAVLDLKLEDGNGLEIVHRFTQPAP
jgi:two-component system response regulator RegA